MPILLMTNYACTFRIKLKRAYSWNLLLYRWDMPLSMREARREGTEWSHRTIWICLKQILKYSPQKRHKCSVLAGCFARWRLAEPQKLDFDKSILGRP